MKKAMWLGVLAVAVLAVPVFVGAADNQGPNEQVIVTTTLEAVR